MAETHERLSILGPFNLDFSSLPSKQPHPGNQEAFRIRVQFPWQRTPQCSIKLEITKDEEVVSPPVFRLLIHDYEEEIKVELLCYSLEEILAEKLRAILQARRKLEEKGWGARARDYYDLWKILSLSKKEINFSAIPDIFRRKCQIRGVTFAEVGDFFPPVLISEIKKNWEGGLKEVVASVPPFQIVREELESALREIFEF